MVLNNLERFLLLEWFSLNRRVRKETNVGHYSLIPYSVSLFIIKYILFRQLYFYINSIEIDYDQERLRSVSCIWVGGVMAEAMVLNWGQICPLWNIW